MHHAKTKRLGYDLGFQKGAFVTAFDRKEYFETHIRPANKTHLEPGIKNNRVARNNATFIEYNKKEREDFQTTVQRHLDQLNKEEKERREQERLDALAAMSVDSDLEDRTPRTQFPNLHDTGKNTAESRQKRERPVPI